MMIQIGKDLEGDDVMIQIGKDLRLRNLTFQNYLTLSLGMTQGLAIFFQATLASVRTFFFLFFILSHFVI